MYIKALSAVAACVFVSACGGGGSGGGGGLAESRASTILQIAENPAYASATPAGNMPTTGSATYNGYGAVIADTSPSTELLAVGAAEVNVNFGTDQVTGRVDDFVNAADAPVGGSLVFADTGVISGSRFPVAGSGTLSSDGRVTNLSVNGVGEFAGNSADAVFVIMSGRAVTGTYVGSADVGIAAVD